MTFCQSWASGSAKPSSPSLDCLSKRRAFYIRQCVARKFCHAMSKRLPPEEFAALRWADLVTVRPDMNSFTDEFDGWACGEIAEQFKWCCLVRCAPKVAVEEHKVRLRGIIQEVAAKLQESLNRAPALREVLEALGSNSTGVSVLVLPC